MKRYLLLICLFLLTACSTAPSAIQQTIGPVEKPTATHRPWPTSTRIPVSKYPRVVPANLEDLVPGVTLKYWGIEPGVSSRQDVLDNRGEPNVTRVYGAYESLHYYYRGLECYLIKDGKVLMISMDDIGLKRKGGGAYIQDYEEVLTPFERMAVPLEMNVWSMIEFDIFPAYGLAMGGSRYTEVFAPADLNVYRDLRKKYPWGCDPFPAGPSVEEAGVQPGRTTREELRSVLGAPTLIVYQDENAPWYYAIESDLYGVLNIYFDDHDVVDSIAIEEVNRKVSYGEIEQEYGQPDLLVYRLGEDGTEYATQAAVYLSRGLEVRASCTGEQCKQLKRSTFVDGKYYFPATDLEGYQKRFKNVVIEKWQGFAVE